MREKVWWWWNGPQENTTTAVLITRLAPMLGDRPLASTGLWLYWLCQPHAWLISPLLICLQEQGRVTSTAAVTRVHGERSDAHAPCNSFSSLLAPIIVSVCEISPDLNFPEFIQPSPWQFRAELFLCLATQTPNWSWSDVYCFNSVIIWRLSSLQTRPVFEPGHILIWIKYQLCPLSIWSYRKTNWVKFHSKEWKCNWILASFEETQIIIIVMSLLIAAERGQRCLFLCISKNKPRHNSCGGKQRAARGKLSSNSGRRRLSPNLWSSTAHCGFAVFLWWFLQLFCGFYFFFPLEETVYLWKA